MEKDDEYFDNVLPDKYKLDEEGLKLNPGDRYSLVSPKEMRRTAAAYRRYRRKHRKEAAV